MASPITHAVSALLPLLTSVVSDQPTRVKVPRKRKATTTMAPSPPTVEPVQVTPVIAVPVTVPVPAEAVPEKKKRAKRVKKEKVEDLSVIETPMPALEQVVSAVIDAEQKEKEKKKQQKKERVSAKKLRAQKNVLETIPVSNTPPKNEEELKEAQEEMGLFTDNFWALVEELTIRQRVHSGDDMQTGVFIVHM